VARPSEVTLTFTPHSRYDAIDITALLAAEHGDMLSSYRRALYCSYHTTAGYLEQSLCSRLEHRRERLDPFFGAFQRLFPPDAAYQHDQLHLRAELCDEQRSVEPRNADSHLAFISSGLRNCVTYVNRPGQPVYFVDLDGVSQGAARTRRTTVLAFDREEVVERASFEVKVSRHPIDSINLGDPRVGVLPRVEELLEKHGVAKGRVDLTLEAGERDAGVTVNEYETLLMRHDLAEVLRDPLRFAAASGRRLLQEPRAIPAKSWGYAKYDAVQILNQLMDALRISESAVERLLAKAMAVAASRRLRLKRTVSMLVSAGAGARGGRIVRGTYQTPILIQWRPSARRARRIEVSITRFE
jgi:thiamine phosphate synthase YjbQ (UPF0047 family)